MHFEDLWTSCEQLSVDSSSKDVVKELLLKIQLYEKISILPNTEETINARTYLLGEILVLLSSISKLDNINVFEGMLRVWKEKSQS